MNGPGRAARNLAEMRRSERQARQRRGSAAPQTSVRCCRPAEKKALRHRAGREAAVSDSAIQAEVRAASERAGATMLAGVNTVFSREVGFLGRE